jgi:menaquinone-dependent protoporphyrinogen oxidase
LSRILIVYGTKEGHTATIVDRMREALAAAGHEVTVVRAGSPPPAVPDNVDGVLVGASVHAGKHQAEIREFARLNAGRLGVTPSAFFQVCLTAADPTPESKAATEGLIDAFVGETGWHPQTTETFAGMLAWTQYDLFTRVLMKLILRKQQLPPDERDTSHDVDYTDYDAVRRFAEAFAASLSGRD